ncbi:MAG: azurin [Pseudoxanthomonas sp.]
MYKTVIALLLIAAAPQAWAKTCTVAIEANDQMKYDLPEIRLAASCTQVTVTLKNTGQFAANVMGHNWVLTRSADFDAVTKGAMAAGLARDFVAAGDARVIAHTKVVGGGQSTSVTFPASKLKKGGDYTFFCSFPGHWTMMKGKFFFG